MHYFPDGSEQSYMLGNGISALIQKNARLLPSGLSYALGGTQRLNEAYVYDKDANLTSLTDLVNGQNNQTLGYDALNRLTAASAPQAWGTQSYAYDALNNLRQNINGSNTINLNVDGNNRLTSAALGTVVFTTYQNDARGNRSAMTYGGVTTQYSFDASNQLLAVPGVASYTYDAAGRRVVKTPAVGGAAAATYSFYNQAGQLLFGYDAATAQGTNYIYLNGKLIARHKGSAVTYLLTDRLGSPVREADTSGNVTASFSYRPYGDLYSGPNQSQPGFTGHVNDPETALTYMQARYYDPAVGRFLSTDAAPPVPGNLSYMNRYAYVGDNPITRDDPSGNYECDGTKGNCGVVRQGIKEIQQAQKKLPAGSKGQQLLQKVLGFYGKEGEKNGVTVNFSNDPTFVGKTITTGKDTVVTINVKGMRTNGQQPGTTFKAEAGATVAHEGQHGVDGQFFGRPFNHAESYVTENNAYTTESYVNEGTNTTSPYGLWHSGWQESGQTNALRASSAAANAHDEVYNSNKGSGQ